MALAHFLLVIYAISFAKGYFSRCRTKTGEKYSSSANFEAMAEKIMKGEGFLAALDQSGGSTPKTLELYGIPDEDYVSGEKSMYDAVHKDTVNRDIEGLPTADYLWEKKRVVPFLKIDVGLMDENNGVQLMKPIPELDRLLKSGKDKGIFGTKMRSVIKSFNPDGIRSVVTQQFELGRQIYAAGLIPILEPEVDIKSPTKAECEDLLKAEILAGLEKLTADEKIILKLSIPSKINHYRELIDHPRVIHVLALSGGYSREEANELLSRQTGMIASFSRALLEGLRHEQSDEEFDQVLAVSIEKVFHASVSK